MLITPTSGAVISNVCTLFFSKSYVNAAKSDIFAGSLDRASPGVSSYHPDTRQSFGAVDLSYATSCNEYHELEYVQKQV
jgi:hypothetical protein